MIAISYGANHQIIAQGHRLVESGPTENNVNMKDYADGFSDGHVPDLTDRFLSTPAADLDDIGVHAGVVTGSYARGHVTPTLGDNPRD